MSIVAGLILSVSLSYTPPVDYDMSLAGNFGEPRPNHFHGGIDVKTAGVEGKPIYSVADGYVSRITVGLYGYGNAVFVSHPDGNTSVYCHLKSFSPRIASLVRRWQYANESYQADIRLSPLDCPLSQGQFIALSGNTGSSTAPHLHLEFHDTKTWAMTDPLDVLKPYVQDNTPPMAHAFMAYPLDGESSFNGGHGRQSFRFTSHELPVKFHAWGRVGFGICANDYSEITYNKYGIRETVLKVDGREVFRSDLDRVPVQQTRMVNSWGDYSHYYRTGMWYMKSFVEHANILSVLTTDESSGIVDFSEERDYHIEYVLRDVHGNSSSYRFTVTGKRSPAEECPQPEGDEAFYLPWNKMNMVSLPGAQLVIPQCLLDGDTRLKPAVFRQPDGLSDCYMFYNHSLPLFHWAEISIAVGKKVKHPEKLYVTSDAASGGYLGGIYKDGWVRGRIRDLGSRYELAYDDVPPRIVPVGMPAWSATGVIRFDLSDDGSGVKTCKGYVDGHFVLFEKKDRSRIVACNLRETPLRRTGRPRRLELAVTDNRGNVSRYASEIVY